MRWPVVRRCSSQERRWRLFLSEIGMGRSSGFGPWGAFGEASYRTNDIYSMKSGRLSCASLLSLG